jgi:hypothetical protein
MALDGLYNFNFKGSASDFTTMFKALGVGGVQIIPSVESNAPGGYLNAVTPLIGKYAAGLVVKVSLGGLGRSRHGSPVADGTRRISISSSISGT